MEKYFKITEVRDRDWKGSFLSTLFYLLLGLALLGLAVPDSFAQTGREKAESLIKESAVLSEDGNIDKAIEVCKEAVKADPDYAEAHDQLGQMLLKKGSYDEAISSFKSGLKINPRLRSAKTGIGFALLKKGDLKGAETVLKEALMLNPYPSMAHYALGLVYEKLNDYDKSVNQFKEGIQKYKSGKK